MLPSNVTMMSLVCTPTRTWLVLFGRVAIMALGSTTDVEMVALAVAPLGANPAVLNVAAIGLSESGVGRG